MRLRNSWGLLVIGLIVLAITGCIGYRFYPVSGVVKLASGQPMANVVVTIGSQSVTTSESGAFSLTEVRAGKQIVTVDMDGYVMTKEIVVKENLGPVEIVVDAINWAMGKSYTYSIEPSENYPDTGGQLTDGVRAGSSYTDKAWVGHLREDEREIIVDLGAVRPINALGTSFLQSSGVGIGLPWGVTFAVSEDGETWVELGEIHLNPDEHPNPGVVPAEMKDLDVQGRYVRLYFKVNVWVFLDEIEVWGY